MRLSLTLCVATSLLAMPAWAQGASGDDWNSFPPANPIAQPATAPSKPGNQAPPAVAAPSTGQPTPLILAPVDAGTASEAPVVSQKDEVLLGNEHSPGTVGDSWDDRHNVRRSAGEFGGTGLLHVSSADLGQVGVLRFTAFAEYFYTHDFPVQGALDTRSAGVFSLAFTPLEWLELFASYSASANTNSLSSPPLLQSLGDVTVGGKFAHRFFTGFYGAIDLRVESFAGVGTQDARKYAFGLAPRAVVTYDIQEAAPKVPVRLHANVGFLWDGTGRLTSQSLTAAEEYALDVNRYNRLAVGVGLEVPLPIVTPFVEYNLAAPLGTAGDLLTPDGDRIGAARVMPQSISAGLKITPLRDITFTAAGDFGLSQGVALGVPTVAPWNLLVGASMAIDPFLRRETRIRETVRGGQRVQLPTGTVNGTVVDSLTQKPLAGVVLTFNGSGLPPVATELESGHYLTQELPAGTYHVTVARDGYKPTTADAQVKVGQSTQLNLALEQQIKLARLNLSVTSKKKSVNATVSFKGAVPKQVNTAEGSEEPVAVDVPAGKYRVEVQAQGYLAQTRELQVTDGAVMGLTFDLTPEPKKKLVIVRENKIEILQQVHFTSGHAAILADSNPLLSQVLDAIIKSNVKRIRVEGHTDNRGNKAVNLKLSQDRAQAVADFLIAQGVDKERLEVQGFGDARPIAPNLTARGRELNRRVEFVILEK